MAPLETAADIDSIQAQVLMNKDSLESSYGSLYPKPHQIHKVDFSVAMLLKLLCIDVKFHKILHSLLLTSLNLERAFQQDRIA